MVRKRNKKSKKEYKLNPEDYCLDDIHRLDSLGVHFKANDPLDGESASILAELEPLLSPSEFRILKESGAYNDIECKVELDDKVSLPHEFPGSAETTKNSPPVSVSNDLELTSLDDLLSDFIKHLGTILEPIEYRGFMNKLVYDLVGKRKINHWDFSDSVVSSILPSFTRFTALRLDAEYKYTTTQFLQVYLNLRHVIATFQTMLLSASVDAMLIYTMGLPFRELTEQELTPSSAVMALRKIVNMDMLNMVNRSDLRKLKLTTDDIKKFMEM